MSVWKVASRWSRSGTKESSVLNLFSKYNIVFAGNNTDKIVKNVKIGDTIAISDGLKIVAVAKVISMPIPITNFSDIQDEDKKRFDYADWVIAFRVEIYNLNHDEIFTTKMGTFHGMGKYSEKVQSLFNKRALDNTKFEINTYTYNIIDNNPNKTSLINQNQQYVIPVYQRPYSWGESQIEVFLNDIFLTFWGSDKTSQMESMFIGTMQLSDKKFADNGKYCQEVIDGQQRITTITLLLKFLQNRYPNNNKLMKLKFDWLDSNVSRGQQSADLKDVILNNSLDNELNKFAQNYKHIKTYFELNINNDEDENIDFIEDDFICHLLENIYFVIIETRAGLSKTLQIFKAINTAGLDLNSTDVFKIRLYEYLSRDSNKNDVFESIDKLYQKIDTNNINFTTNKPNDKVTSMAGILTIYKYYLISKYNLKNKTLWKMGTGTFFERLFDTILDIKQWTGFSDLKQYNNILDVETIDKIIEIRYSWHDKHYGINGSFDDFNSMLSLRLLWWSRYSRYWIIPFLYLMRDDATSDKYNELIQAISRLYISYSLLYQKQTNEIHGFTQENIAAKLTKDIDIDIVIKDIRDKYLSRENDTKKVINGNIFSNPKIKNILMRMSASLDENENGHVIKDIERKIFTTKIDIEHIKSRNDDDFKANQNNHDLWKDILNTVGNLVILEYSINRSIGKKPFLAKTKQYTESTFISVQQLSQKNKWELSDAKIRKQSEIIKIENFIYR